MFIRNGLDIVKVSRIEKLLDKKRDSFINRLFTPYELAYISDTNYNPQTVSGIFAAKEAVAKLLGKGIGEVNWKDIEIGHNSLGKPQINLYNKGRETMKNLGIYTMDISISHEKEYAVALAIGLGVRDLGEVDLPQEIKNLIGKRTKDSHKGSYGRVGVVAGSRGMTGAAYLTAMAALRTGSGLVYSILPASLSDILSIKLTEAIIKPIEDQGSGFFSLDSFKDMEEILKNMDVLALGPGIGVNRANIELVKAILLSYNKTIVLDADGINCLAKGDLSILDKKSSNLIITPHPGELAGLLKVDMGHLQDNRLKYSKIVAEKYRLICVLKGANTIVASPRGQVFINPRGNPGMATAGSGDLLTGVIASLVGQGIPAFESAVLGVYLHGLAGDMAMEDKGEYGMLARDILENIPYSIKKLQF